jgi:hypothetical protein
MKNATTKKPDIAVAILTPTEGTERAAHKYGHCDKIPFGILQLDFANGLGLMLDTIELAPEVIGQALMHGLKQKLVDAAAMTRNPETGRSATVQDKHDAVKAVLDRLLSGEWNKRREGGPTGGLLKRALLKMYDGRKTPDQIDAYLAKLSDKEKAALRKNPKVAEAIEELRAADLKDGEEMPDLLAELDAMEDTRDAAEGVEVTEIPAEDDPKSKGGKGRDAKK